MPGVFFNWGQETTRGPQCGAGVCRIIWEKKARKKKKLCVIKVNMLIRVIEESEEASSNVGVLGIQKLENS